MPSTTTLKVSPHLLADAAGELTALTSALADVAPAYRGPQRPPPLGDATCTSAYAGAHQELAGVLTSALASSRRLAGSLSAAAVLYAVLDSPAQS